jgi:hypothetical protein
MSKHAALRRTEEAEVRQVRIAAQLHGRPTPVKARSAAMIVAAPRKKVKGEGIRP